MASDTNDMIDRALDAAEAKLAESHGETDVPDLPTVEHTDVVEEAATAEAVKASNQESSSRVRDNSGKFTKGQSQKSAQIQKAPAKKAAVAEQAPAEQVSDQEANPETDGVSGAEESSTSPTIEVPEFWPAELKAAVAEAKSEDAKALVKHFATLDVQREQWARRHASEGQRGKEFEQRLNADMSSPDEVNRHKAQLRVNGLKDEVDELHRYRAWDKLFNVDVKTAIADLMRKNNLTHQDFAEDQGQSQQAQFQDPRVDEALTEARTAKEQFTMWQQEQEDAVRATELASFKEGKDSTGNQRSAFVDAYSPQIAAAITEIRAQYPHVSRTDALNHAYEFVLSQVRKLHGVAVSQKPIAAAPKPPAPAPADAKKARAAASSVTGAPVNGAHVQRPRLKGDNFSQKLDSALDNVLEQVGSR